MHKIAHLSDVVQNFAPIAHHTHKKQLPPYSNKFRRVFFFSILYWGAFGCKRCVLLAASQPDLFHHKGSTGCPRGNTPLPIRQRDWRLASPRITQRQLLLLLGTWIADFATSAAAAAATAQAADVLMQPSSSSLSQAIMIQK